MLKINDVMRETGLGESVVLSLVKRGKFPLPCAHSGRWRQSDIDLYKVYDEKICAYCKAKFGKRGRKYKDRVPFVVSAEERDMEKWRKVAKDKGINLTELVIKVADEFTSKNSKINVKTSKLEKSEQLVRRVEKSSIENWRKAAKNNGGTLSQYISAVLNRYCDAYLKKYSVQD